MMNIQKYLEIDSSFRDRTIYPYSSNFELQINGGLSKSGLDTIDPILDAYPLYIFKGNVISHSDSFNGGTRQAVVLGALASSIDNFYNGATIIDTTTGESNLILEYNGFLKRAVLKNPFSSTWSPFDLYTIQDLSTVEKIFWQGGTTNENGFIGKIITNTSLSETSVITGYDSENKIITIDPPFSALLINAVYEISDSINTVNGITTSIQTGPNTVTLNAGDSSIDDFYKGQFIRFTNGPLKNVVRFITGYNGTTKVLSFGPSITVSLFNPQTYEILQFTRDNVVGLSRKTPYGMVTLKLIDLILPNIILKNSMGGKIAFYPFVYVVIVDKSNETNNMIVSNNPNSYKAVFKCPITDIATPEISTFIKLKCRMVQSLKLNSSIIFKVLLPNGEPLIFDDNEWFSPKPPNPQMQISASFKITFNES
jgi:hypothetical protein